MDVEELDKARFHGCKGSAGQPAPGSSDLENIE
jgi:hypothetical protein